MSSGYVVGGNDAGYGNRLLRMEQYPGVQVHIDGSRFVKLLLGNTGSKGEKQCT
jgi:hypothetical protein